jgi:hypothetical protein
MKTFERRRRDRSQLVRRSVRGAFVLVSLWLGVTLVFVGVVAWAQLTGHWQTHVPDERYFDLIPNASAFAHPSAPGR